MLKTIRQNWAVHMFAGLLMISAVVLGAARVPAWVTGSLPGLVLATLAAEALNQGEGCVSMAAAITAMGTVVQAMAGSPMSSLHIFVAMAGGSLCSRLFVLFTEKFRQGNREMRIVQLTGAAMAVLYTIMYITNSLWVKVGGVSIQLSELLKLLYTIQLAALASTGNVKQRFILVIISACGNFILLAGLSELGTAVTLFITAMATVYFLVPLSWAAATSVVILGCAAVGGTGAVWLAGHPEVPLPDLLMKLALKISDRLQIWLAPETLDTLGAGYQSQRAAAALLAGSSMGTDRPISVPVGDSDYILVTLAGNFGVILTIIIIGFFVVFYCLLGRECRRYTHWQFPTFTSYMILVISSLLPAAGSVGLIPLGGTPIPFFSAGGSALFTSFGLLTMLLNNASIQERREKEARFTRRGIETER